MKLGMSLAMNWNLSDQLVQLRAVRHFKAVWATQDQRKHEFVILEIHLVLRTFQEHFVLQEHIPL